MRSLLGVVVLVALGRVAAADGDVNWDGTYTLDGTNGGELCPHAAEHSSIVVANSTFSIAWNIRVGDARLIRVGTFEGSVRPSGFVTVKATLQKPLPAEAMTALKEMDDDIGKLKTIADEVHGVFESHSGRTLELSTGECSTAWHADAAAKGAKRPKQDKAAKLKPPPPLAAGSAKWDTTYIVTSGSRDDWRCPKNDFKELVVSKGRFSIAYVVNGMDGQGHDYGDMTLGQIDGSAAANGKVTLRTWFSVTELPPEVAYGRKADKATLDYVRAFAPTMTFSTHGGARLAELTYGDACELHFESKGTFKQGSTVSSPKVELKQNGASCNSHRDCKSDNCRVGHCDDPSDE